MISHADVSGSISMLNRLLMEKIEVKQAPVRQIFVVRKMACVTHVVTNVKLIEVHFPHLFRSLKETAAGEGLTLFGAVIKPFLAVFQISVSNILMICDVF